MFLSKLLDLNHSDFLPLGRQDLCGICPSSTSGRQKDGPPSIQRAFAMPGIPFSRLFTCHRPFH
jgi:hypothetical protein